MNRISLMLAAAVLSAAACAQKDGVTNAGADRAANSAAPASSPSFQITPQPVEADRISLADAKKEFDAGTAVFVDVRGSEAFNQERVAGALNIPVADIEANISKLPKGKKIIVYCS